MRIVQVFSAAVGAIGLLLCAYLLPQTANDFKWAVAVFGVVSLIQCVGNLNLLLGVNREDAR